MKINPCQKIFRPKSIQSKKICSKKKFESRKFWLQKFQVKRSGSRKFKSKFFLEPSFNKSLVKIESVTAEIFLLWTNIAKTNVDWTNTTIMVGIC